jgi:hypothetical protein
MTSWYVFSEKGKDIISLGRLGKEGGGGGLPSARLASK